MPSSSTPLRQPAVLPPDEDDAIEKVDADLRQKLVEGAASADRGEFIEQEEVEQFMKTWISDSQGRAAALR